MNDVEREEREERAIWKLEQAGYRVTRQGGWHIVAYDAVETGRLDNLRALVELAEAIYADH